ncbi:MAG: VOC family protein [Nanoarchaeales archaeon]|nr:VOC family protein [Nanoarchaeales archaeon]
MENNKINYIEFKANNLEEIKVFYSKVFNWKFTDYGPEYTSFSNSGIYGGFEKTKDEIINGALVVLFYKELKEIKEKILNSNGKISKDIFSFPGGHRLQFIDPSGNELAVWSDK